MIEEERKIVIPGEVIASGEDYLPSEGTERQGNDIIAIRYGLAEEQNRLVKVLSLSGTYSARKGNVVIGECVNVTFNGWILDIGSPSNAFLPVSEFPKYVHADELEEFIKIGDIVAAKVMGVKRKSIDLSVKLRGLGRLNDGMIIKINSNKVPRVIGKGGSMINVIKDETKCNITVGQNGYVWIKGDTTEDELLAKNGILFVTENATINGLTEKLQEWFNKKNKGGKKNE